MSVASASASGPVRVCAAAWPLGARPRVVRGYVSAASRAGSTSASTAVRTTVACSSTGYSRTSWRTAILNETQDEAANASSAPPSAPDQPAPAPGSTPRSHEDAAAGSGSDGAAAAGGAALSASELRVKLSLAASSGRLDLTDCRLAELPPGVLELTELEELQLSGNCLAELPDGLSRLTALRRLGLAGNQLSRLPPSLGALTALEGLWLHGNLLAALPAELGRLGALRSLSLAGNCLESIPPGCLPASLTDLTLAGNRLSALPPGALAPLTRLRKLALNGNRLGAETEGGAGMQLGLGRHMTALTELMLQGNCLETVDPGVFECPALVELSLADNCLSSLPATLSAASSLARLHLFGNRLAALPAGQLAALPALSYLWLEGNPLSGGAVRELLARAVAGGMPRLKALGLDQAQLAAAGGEGAPVVPPNVRVGCVLGSGPGYFKLQYGPQRGSGCSAAGGGAPTGGGSGIRSSNELLVVAFGSAPGTPNWGGLLSRVYKTASTDSEKCFDVLYVADPSRDWYGGGNEQLFAYYRARMSSYTAHYPRVLLLGDSMGATAALLFADLATAVLAFCPQVDLSVASIRPGRPAAWLAALRSRLLASVRSSRGRLEVLTGTWQHDLAQAQMLPQHGRHGQGQAQAEAVLGGTSSSGDSARRWLLNRSGRGATQLDETVTPSSAPATARSFEAAPQRSPWSWQEPEQLGADAPNAPPTDERGAGPNGGAVHVRVFSVDSHRLAAALDARGQLVALVRDAVLHQLGMRSGKIRISNLL